MGLQSEIAWIQEGGDLEILADGRLESVKLRGSSIIIDCFDGVRTYLVELATEPGASELRGPITELKPEHRPCGYVTGIRFENKQSWFIKGEWIEKSSKVDAHYLWLVTIHKLKWNI
jgi:hypothetical protein